MSAAIDLLLTDLRHLLSELGYDGGQISPSVYDTAQVARLAPPATGVWPTLEWLAAQQQPDGGWGDPATPLARTVPTLAAVLALHTHGMRKSSRNAAQEGLSFLYRQASHWAGPLPEDLPIGVELLLPTLLQVAVKAGLSLPTAPYQRLTVLGQRRRELIQRIRPGAGTSAVYSWESWGERPDPALLDPTGSVGHSPAATAAWIVAAHDIPELADHRATAQRYLSQAAAATGTGVPGVLPSVWPLNRFEHLFGPYALMMAGLLDHPALSDLAQAQIENIAQHARPNGYSFSDDFEPDGDDTAAGVALLKQRGYPVDLTMLRQYDRGEHFCTYPYELQISLSATARAVSALRLAGVDVSRHAERLAAHQSLDGRWSGDKWSRSWLYTTSHIVQALQGLPGQREALAKAQMALLAHQHANGSWGSDGRSSHTETAYAVLTLRMLMRDQELAPQIRAQLARARRFMRDSYRPFQRSEDYCWIGKEIYRPYRVDRAFELTAMLAMELDYAESIY